MRGVPYITVISISGGNSPKEAPTSGKMFGANFCGHGRQPPAARGLLLERQFFQIAIAIWMSISATISISIASPHEPGFGFTGSGNSLRTRNPSVLVRRVAALASTVRA